MCEDIVRFIVGFCISHVSIFIFYFTNEAVVASFGFNI